MAPLTLTSKPNKIHKFQFQTSGIWLFTDAQKLYGPEISQYLPCMLQFLDNLWRLFIFYNYIEREIKSKIIGKILDLPKNTATEYVIRHF